MEKGFRRVGWTDRRADAQIGPYLAGKEGGFT